MATKKIMREETHDLSERQKNIIRLRKKLNTRDPDAVNVFTKYKIITYIFIIVFPPYAMYRLWSKNTEFNFQEKMVQTTVSLLYMYLVVVNVMGGII